MLSWPAPLLPTLPGTGPERGSGTPRPASWSPSGRGHRPDVRLRHHPLRRDPPRPRRDVPRLRPASSGLARRRPRGALRAERHRRRRPAARARRARPARTGPSSPSARSSCSARTWRRCGCCRRSTTSARSRRSPRSRRGRRAARRRRRLPARRRHRRRLLRRSTADPRSASESGSTARPMLALFAERGGDPERPGKSDPLDSLLWRGARGRASRAWDGAAFGRGPARLAHRVRRDRAGPPRRGLRRAGRRQRPGLPAPRDSAAHAEALTGGARSPTRYVHAGDGRPRRREDDQVPRQPGVRLRSCGRRRRPDGDPAGAARGPLPRRLGVAGGPAPRRRGRLARWRAAVACPPAPPADAAARAVRARLADDLDSPGALACVDEWPPTSAPDGPVGGGAPALVRDAVDALLGVALQP